MKKILLLFCVLASTAMSAQTIGIVGPAANGWPDPATNPNPDIMLTDNGDGTYSIDALTLTTGPAKFRADMDWAVSYGGDNFPNGMVTGGDIPVQAGVYDIVLDLNSSTYTFIANSGFTTIEVSGTALDGAGNFQLGSTDGETYTGVTTRMVDGNLLFQDPDTSTTYGAVDFPSGTATAGGPAIQVLEGFYKIDFNLTTGAYSFEVPEIGIVGPAAAGWPDATNTDILMTKTNGDVYTLNNQVLTDGELKFRQDLSWNVNWGGSAFPSGPLEFNGGNNIAVTAGTYDIVFSRGMDTYAFNATASTLGAAFSNFKVYPNPASSSWNFSNPDMSIATITLYSNTGKLIQQAAPSALNGRIEVGSLASGLYLAQVSLTDGSIHTVQLVKR